MCRTNLPQERAWRPGESVGRAARCIGPAVGRFIETDALQLQVVAVGVAVDGVQAVKSDTGQILCRRHAVEENRLVAGMMSCAMCEF